MNPGKQLGITAEHVQKALIECNGSRKDAAILLGTNKDIVRAIIRHNRSVYRFTPPPKPKNIKPEDVYLPTMEEIDAACWKFKDGWDELEERRRRTLCHDDYEIPTGMSFRTLDGRSR
jgi:hypothetical protein